MRIVYTIDNRDKALWLQKTLALNGIQSSLYEDMFTNVSSSSLRADKLLESDTEFLLIESANFTESNFLEMFLYMLLDSITSGKKMYLVRFENERIKSVFARQYVSYLLAQNSNDRFVKRLIRDIKGE